MGGRRPLQSDDLAVNSFGRLQRAIIAAVGFPGVPICEAGKCHGAAGRSGAVCGQVTVIALPVRAMMIVGLSFGLWYFFGLFVWLVVGPR